MKQIFLLVLPCLCLMAQPLSLNEALDLLKAQNLEVKMAKMEIQSAGYAYEMANAQDYGQLDFIQNISRSNDAGNVFGFKLTSREASFGDFGFADFDPTNPNILAVRPNALNYPDDQNYFQSKLAYALPLYTGKKLSSYQNIAKEMKNIALLEKEDKLQEKIFETRKAYFDMALLEASLKNLRQIHANISRLEAMTKEMITEGYAKKIDLLEVQSKKANVSRIISELESSQELLYHYLSFLLNQEVSQIQTPDYDLPQPSISAEEILSNNLDIQKALSALKINENMVTAEESRYLPTIGAMAELQTADNTFLGDANDHKSYTVGLQLKWNFFSGGSDSAAVEKARTQNLKMQTQTRFAKEGISLKIKEIQTRIKTASAEIKSLKAELALARQIYENYEGRYKEQLSSMSDVIIKQSSWLEKVLELLKAQNNRNTQIFALERLGTPSQGDQL